MGRLLGQWCWLSNNTVVSRKRHYRDYQWNFRSADFKWCFREHDRVNAGGILLILIHNVTSNTIPQERYNWANIEVIRIAELMRHWQKQAVAVEAALKYVITVIFSVRTEGWTQSEVDPRSSWPKLMTILSATRRLVVRPRIWKIHLCWYGNQAAKCNELRVMHVLIRVILVLQVVLQQFHQDLRGGQQ